MPELNSKKSVTVRFEEDEVEWIEDIATHFERDASWVLRYTLKVAHTILFPKKHIKNDEISLISDICTHLDRDVLWVIRHALKTTHKIIFPPEHTKNPMSDSVRQCNTPSDTPIYTLDSVKDVN